MNRDSPSKPRSAIPGKCWLGILKVWEKLCLLLWLTFSFLAYLTGETEDPYPSLSDIHDYEPNLEFDDTELQQPVDDEGM